MINKEMMDLAGALSTMTRAAMIYAMELCEEDSKNEIEKGFIDGVAKMSVAMNGFAERGCAPEAVDTDTTMEFIKTCLDYTQYVMKVRKVPSVKLMTFMLTVGNVVDASQQQSKYFEGGTN